MPCLHPTTVRKVAEEQQIPIFSRLARPAPLVWDAYSLCFQMLDITVNYDSDGSSKDSEFEHLTWIDGGALTGTA
ncbi:hypothetical protein BPAE_0001g02630 [Botrytis paeoniae]|uniref:Uncharacterized protein n=1 Tax=Botrytis paeoniae TaxID=278948 RepID=A0A4Z1GAZ2_9HELO|nr:hypothetical protein BPAE_0001g02630 [Botrytis paeoniae]